MIYSKICKICGKEFETSYPNKIYCNPVCARKAHLEKETHRSSDKYNQYKIASQKNIWNEVLKSQLTIDNLVSKYYIRRRTKK